MPGRPEADGEALPGPKPSGPRRRRPRRERCCHHTGARRSLWSQSGGTLRDMKDASSRRLPNAGGPAPSDPGDRPSEQAEAPTSSRSLTVRDARAAEALVDPTTLRHLAPFLGRDRSVAEAARETGEKPNTTLRRVRRFVDMGLLRVWREVPRAGRPVKRYRAVADVFFVPFDATGAESLEAALAERDAYWERLLRRNVVRGRMEALGT